MVIKNIIYSVLLIASFTVTGQIEGLKKKDTDYFIKFDKDEFIFKDPLFENFNTNSNESEIKNFEFGWNSYNNSITYALNNAALLKIARDQSQRKWFAKQKNEIIKPAIEKKLGKSFSNYEHAKNALLSNIEIKNIVINHVPIETKYQNIRHTGFSKQKTHLGKLKLLKIRKEEILAGNINNPEFGAIKINNIPIKNIKTIKELNQLWQHLYNTFCSNTAATHVSNHVYKMLLKIENESKLIDLAVTKKNRYYRNFNEWDQINYMQFLINYEEIKKYSSLPYYIPKLLELSNKFKDTDKANDIEIEKYALNNRDGGHSVFSDEYFDELVEELTRKYNNDAREAYYDALDQIRFLREQALKKLLDNTSASEFGEEITNNLTGKELCIYKKLKELNLFKNTVQKFSKGNYNLTFDYGTECNGSTYGDACTDADDLANGNILIKIISSGQQSLDFAATLLHEAIHAEMYKYVDEHKKGIDPNDRKNVLHYYRYYKAKNENDVATSDAQHQAMQDMYIIPIAEAIRALDGGKFPLEHYKGFAWDGLYSQYEYDAYLDENGQLKTMTKTQFYNYINMMNDVMKSTNFKNNCN